MRDLLAEFQARPGINRVEVSYDDPLCVEFRRAVRDLQQAREDAKPKLQVAITDLRDLLVGAGRAPSPDLCAIVGMLTTLAEKQEPSA